MLSLPLAMKWKNRDGTPIWNPYPGLRAVGATPRRGQLSMVIGPPGVGKTAFITDWTLAINKNPNGEYFSVMNFSADSDRGTVGNRVAASVTRNTVEYVEDRVASNDSAVWTRIDEATNHIGYCFLSSPSFDDILVHLECFALVEGKWPDVIVVDNLLDVDAEPGHEGIAETCMWLKQLATETQAAVILLHHARGDYADGLSPLPLSAVLGQVTKPQRLILTLHRPDPNILGVSVVKNSNGKANADGYEVMKPIEINYENMFFSHN